MSALAHFFESEGLATTLLALIRKHAEVMKPPRTLSVPFELGRPFGAPGEPEFQSRVLKAVLALLERERPAAGCILDDFPDSPPGPPPDMEGWTCPINLAPPVEDMSDSEKLLDVLSEEIGRLQPWHDEAIKASGRSISGISKLTPLAIAKFMVDLLADPEMASPDADMSLGDFTKLATDDLRLFYLQAANAQPGKSSDVEIGDWIWGQTNFARTVGELNKLCEASEDPELKRLAALALIPHHQRHRFA